MQFALASSTGGTLANLRCSNQGKLGSKRTIVQQDDDRNPTRTFDSSNERKKVKHHSTYPIMHLIMLHMHPYWIRYSEGIASFIVYLPVGDMMPNNLLDVSSIGWCNSYQRLHDAKALRYTT